MGRRRPDSYYKHRFIIITEIVGNSRVSFIESSREGIYEDGCKCQRANADAFSFSQKSICGRPESQNQGARKASRRPRGCLKLIKRGTGADKSNAHKYTCIYWCTARRGRWIYMVVPIARAAPKGFTKHCDCGCVRLDRTKLNQIPISMGSSETVLPIRKCRAGKRLDIVVTIAAMRHVI